MKKNNRNILLLTSCIEPLIKKNISNYKIKNNLNDLNQNIENLFINFPKINLDYEIYLADCSSNFDLNHNHVEFLNQNPYDRNLVIYLRKP